MKKIFTIIKIGKKFKPVYGEFLNEILEYVELIDGKLIVDENTEIRKISLVNLPNPDHSKYYLFDNPVDAKYTADMLNRQSEED